MRAGAVRSLRAFLAALGLEETLDRGVKNLLNFLGVMEGNRRSLGGGSLGGERIWLFMNESFSSGALFSAMVLAPH